MGREGAETKERGKRREEELKSRLLSAHLRALHNLSGTGWHSLTIPVLWQTWFQPLWIGEQLQDHPCAEQHKAQHTPRLPPHADHGSLHLLLPCKFKRPFTAEVRLLLLGVILCCSILCCWLSYCGAKQQRSPSKELQNASASCRGLF